MTFYLKNDESLPKKRKYAKKLFGGSISQRGTDRDPYQNDTVQEHWSETMTQTKSFLHTEEFCCSAQCGTFSPTTEPEFLKF